MNVLAVGDIHTKIWIIEAVELIIDKYDSVVFVGDYADDWGASPIDTINTWKALKRLQETYPEKVKLVMGNHDYIYTNYTKTISSGYNPVTQLMLGTPENKELKSWLNDIPIKHEIDGIVYSHAGYTEGWEDGEDLWSDESPIWVRPIIPNFLARRQYIAGQVFGHTPVGTCYEVEPNVWCIDTFSTRPDGTTIGDRTALEIKDGKKFKKIEMKNDDNSITSIKREIS